MGKNVTRCHPLLREGSVRFFATLRMTVLLILFSPSVSATTLAPVSIIDVARHGLPIPIDTVTRDAEMDIPLLTPDGNVLHLLGMSHPRVLPNTAFVEVIADLAGVTQPDCVAHVEVLVETSTQHPLAQKLKMTCLGQSIHDAFVNPPLPPGEGRGEGVAQ